GGRCVGAGGVGREGFSRGWAGPTVGGVVGGASGTTTEIVPDQRIGVGVEDLLTVTLAVPVGVRVERIGAVDVDLIPVSHPIPIGFRVVRVGAILVFEGIGQIVSIGVEGAVYSFGIGSSVRGGGRGRVHVFRRRVSHRLWCWSCVRGRC